MQQQEMNRVRLDELRGEPVYDSAGEKIGSVEEIYYDAATQSPEWIGIGTGFFSTKRVLVPVEGAQLNGDGLMVAYSKDHVKDGPDVDEDEISSAREAELCAHYGLQGGQSRTTQPANDADQSITRSEEEIEVGSRQVDAGSARLRKWVETEPVSLDVELRREVAHVTRERIDEPVGDHEFTEEQVDVPLHAEKPVVQKQAVAKERIGLQKDVQTERQTVRDELKKEHVEVEGDVEGSN
ncbi:MAG: DUF2382 domain-containing protein [Gaiellaceae bacterium]|jgi:uncharacterized protein (TIGR02271 family)